ncbi:MAG: hypothetical protein E7215_12540 [Clostridium sulfidigenes]|uniref:Uncharacterized protein n=1 Tax=Clostridium sulfidigenes TaxID=318464 RepID=A0A927WD35_9CLOT|nr:hypothetical protein [Clostridium sulfidigenes]
MTNLFSKSIKNNKKDVKAYAIDCGKVCSMSCDSGCSGSCKDTCKTGCGYTCGWTSIFGTSM